MYSKVRIAGHPVHPMLIAFPVAFYTATFAALIAYRAADDPFWFRVALVANAVGVIMAVLAAIPGVIDGFAGVPRESHARRTVLMHAVLNTGALALFAVNWMLLRGEWASTVPDDGPALLVSGLGLALTIAAGSQGWKLVQTHHVGVDPLPAADLADAVQAEARERQRRGAPQQRPAH